MPSGIYKRKGLSEETKRKIGLANSISHKGLKHSPATVAKIINSRKWYKHSAETKLKIGMKKRGKPLHALRGDKNPSWKGGTVELRQKINKLFQYRQWRSDIYNRDNFTCVLCGNNISGNLECDHYPKPFFEIIRDNKIDSTIKAMICEELWDLNNGRTLCKQCHRKTETYGRRKKIR